MYVSEIGIEGVIFLAAGKTVDSDRPAYGQQKKELSHQDV